MTIDRDRLVRIFDELGRRLTVPTTICVIGSTPAIVLGQPDRQSQDIDVWRPHSQYDDTQFRCLCEALGLLYDPRSELDPDAIYVQIVRPGLVKLPENFNVEIVGQYGVLTVNRKEDQVTRTARSLCGSAGRAPAQTNGGDCRCAGLGTSPRGGAPGTAGRAARVVINRPRTVREFASRSHEISPQRMDANDAGAGRHGSPEGTQPSNGSRCCVSTRSRRGDPFKTPHRAL